MTVADLVRARADDDGFAVYFEDERWTWRAFVAGAGQRAHWLLDSRQPGPFHIGVLLENVPEYPLLLSAAALVGATVVGINPTRRGEELARDIRHCDVQLVVTEPTLAPLLDGLDIGVPADRVFDIASPAYAKALAPYEGAPLPDVSVDDDDLFLLLFTSGVSGTPKACRCTQGRLARIGAAIVQMFQLTPGDVCYSAMPMFHSNALMANWAGALTAGAATALRRKFSASGFLPDVRKYGVTYANYVGKPLSYVLATPEQPDDADNTLTRVFGNEAAEADIDRFATRFGCIVVDSYGSTEGGASIARISGMPKGALGRGAEGVTVLDPDTGLECPAGKFDETGRLVNADEAVGELVNRAGAKDFEGYYKHPEADAARVRDGIYWTGDLGYKDADGWLYFAGRSDDWLRVDGENFGAAPVERILFRFPPVTLCAVYAVPDEVAGDQVMAALRLKPGATFDPDEFAAFLEAQADLGTKWAPRYVRVVDELPLTPTNKVLKRQLRTEALETDDPIWERPGRELRFEQRAASR
jgi:acyl-CoA synthetase (AMP-forming)/AMP-acid ligase II